MAAANPIAVPLLPKGTADAPQSSARLGGSPRSNLGPGCLRQDQKKSPLMAKSGPWRHD